MSGWADFISNDDEETFDTGIRVVDTFRGMSPTSASASIFSTRSERSRDRVIRTELQPDEQSMIRTIRMPPTEAFPFGRERRELVQLDDRAERAFHSLDETSMSDLAATVVGRTFRPPPRATSRVMTKSKYSLKPILQLNDNQLMYTVMSTRDNISNRRKQECKEELIRRWAYKESMTTYYIGSRFSAIQLLKVGMYVLILDASYEGKDQVLVHAEGIITKIEDTTYHIEYKDGTMQEVSVRDNDFRFYRNLSKDRVVSSEPKTEEEIKEIVEKALTEKS
jgi:hypothetical protein